MGMETVRMPDIKPNEVPDMETLLHLLRSTEHDFVERKSKKQNGDWLQTAVAFANSMAIGYPAVLFVGVDDHGTPHETKGASEMPLKQRLESLQKSITDTLDQAYPPIYRFCVPLELSDGGCIAVIIPGSEARPHFAGKAYVRKGPSTTEASEAQFDALIAERSSKVYELGKLIGKQAVLEKHLKNRTSVFRKSVKIVDCNRHYLTCESDDPLKWVAVPIERLSVTFDYDKGVPVLQVWEPGN
jgi:hypothetical protein